MSSRHDERPEDATDQLPPAVVQNRVVVVWDGGSTVMTLPLRGSMTIGRGMDCDVRIDHASVSRQHATLHVGDEVVLEDLGSSNGTRVRGRTLSAGERVAIAADAIVEIGATMLVVQGPRFTPARSARSQLRRETSPPARSAEGLHADIVLRDPAMLELHRLVAMVAKSAMSVLVCGETGVGKEVVAHALHRLSPRAAGPFVSLNCAAMPDTLLESELFGHDRGAFTGAREAKVGLVEAASSGTFFLDEVGEMSLTTQAKLLRVLEAREVMRVGSVKPTPVDVRFVAATNRNLEELVASGEFRQDLYFRLNAISICVPPLRERRLDIVALAEHFVTRAAHEEGVIAPTLSSEAVEALERYAWPGNVRELKNVIAHAMIFREGAPTITVAHLSPAARSAASDDVTSVPSKPRPHDAGLKGEVEQFERKRIVDALERCHGNQTRAAALLGISRRTLVSRLGAYDLPRPRK